MVMGTSGIRDVRGSMKTFHPNEIFTNHIAINGNTNTHLEEEPPPFLAQNPFLDILNGSSNLDTSASSGENLDGDDAFSDIALTYISQMLMDEDDKIDNFHEYSALRATEKNFYDVLGQNYPPLPIQPRLDSGLSSDSPEDSISLHNGNSSGPSSSSSNWVPDGIWLHDFPDYRLSPPLAMPAPIDFSSQSSFGSVNGLGSILEGQEDFLDGISQLFSDSESAWQFKKGEEEARKFLPSEDRLVIDVEGWMPLKLEEESRLPEVKVEKEEREYESRGRKNRHSEDFELDQGRSSKHTAVSFEEAEVRTHMFDDTLLCNGEFPKAIRDLREAYHIGPNKTDPNGHSKDSSSGRGRGKKKQQAKKEVVDLRTLLIQCAQMMAADDRRSTSEILKQIRQNSSPVGDGSQRLAHYFADGLEARLAGTGSDIYNDMNQKRRTASDYLKAYQLYLAVCPFKKISYFFGNQHILDIAEKATRIHVVDYGIGFGFQWPSLMQRMAMLGRPGGPPKLRITGIDCPQPGFRPRERLDETGRRLAEYAQEFRIPFEYKGIANRWEDVRVEDIGIDKDEVLVVNSMYMFHRLADESVMVDSPRNTVLNTIRKMNPAIFTHGVYNGSYSAPFFVTRFREAVFFFSATFDMLETNVPREDEQRLLIEREIFGREIINVVACEGLERVERPEAYKQWQVRHLRAGFAQRPMSRHIFKKAKDKVTGCYNKDFVIDEDGRWLLQGWKGRILFAISTWKPNNSAP